MKLESRREGTALVLKSDGEVRVDGTNASEFQDAVKSEISETDRVVVLDMQDVTYMSSAGLRVVLLIVKDLKRQGGELAVCSLRDQVKEVFVISGFDKMIPIRDSLDSAIVALS